MDKYEIPIQPLLDQLFYWRSGDFDRFKNSVNKLFNYEGHSIFQKHIGNISRNFLERLCCLGLVESYKKNRSIYWMVNEPCAIASGKGEAYLFYPLSLITTESPAFLKEKVLFNLYVKGVGSIDVIGYVATYNNPPPFASISNPNDQQLYQLVPQLEEVLLQSSEDAKSVIIEDDHLEYFNFKQQKWISIHERYLPKQCLYRMKYSSSSYWFIRQGPPQNKVYEISDKDWAFTLSRFILKELFSVKWDPSTSQLEIDPKNYYKLPLLIKKSLFVPSSQFPSYKNGDFLIDNISREHLEAYINKKVWECDYEKLHS